MLPKRLPWSFTMAVPEIPSLSIMDRASRPVCVHEITLGSLPMLRSPILVFTRWPSSSFLGVEFVRELRRNRRRQRRRQRRRRRGQSMGHIPAARDTWAWTSERASAWWCRPESPPVCATQTGIAGGRPGETHSMLWAPVDWSWRDLCSWVKRKKEKKEKEQMRTKCEGRAERCVAERDTEDASDVESLGKIKVFHWCPWLAVDEKHVLHKVLCIHQPHKLSCLSVLHGSTKHSPLHYFLESPPPPRMQDGTIWYQGFFFHSNGFYEWLFFK